MSWALGTPLKAKLAYSEFGHVTRTSEGRVEVTDFMEGLAATQDLNNKDVEIDEQAAYQLSTSIGGVRFNPETMAALIDLLESCAPKDGPLKDARRILNQQRDEFLLMVHDAVEELEPPLSQVTPDFPTWTLQEDVILNTFAVIGREAPHANFGAIRIDWHDHKIRFIRVDPNVQATYMLGYHTFIRQSITYTDALEVAAIIRTELNAIAAGDLHGVPIED